MENMKVFKCMYPLFSLAAKVLKTILNIFQIDLAKKKLFVYLRPDFEKERSLVLCTKKDKHEKDISTVKAQAKEQTRIQGAYGISQRKEGSCQPESEGKKEINRIL
ncbi:hypothetical protein SAMN06265375_10248 [Muriicola jejuensis]|nr:hypothetical protein SAMN06265375_10248 [Muriicola jejuensis]